MAKHEDAKNLLAVIQSIVLSLAVAGGAIWGYYEFSVSRADHDYELNDRKVREQAVINVSLEIDQAIVAEAGCRQIVVRATVENRGTRNIPLELGRTPFAIAQLGAIGEEVSSWKEPQRYEALGIHSEAGASRVSGVFLRPGSFIDFVMVACVERGKTYLVTFGAKSPSKEEDEATEALDAIGLAPGDQSWGVSQVAFVE
ncbi:MAG: hypothetical protein KJ970_13805 [Candidatus Eisenbacteria bacterium]|uniref:Uncharacterized protein n=1 Tax=Eiseniibacteriota bacterium TaxID=2212470 RepID=A0A948W792_UNCEI|nr:hypothetical protein [Candidatus Eisenbacteria bacterium]MBU1949552.1 hypothetical protein [Candidatus Eisenbacteria bacterium]MBU2691990.1 hypothetical protein [Candidatus Eisenbacteria bacterium]